MNVGQTVRIVNPDRDDHAHGVVVDLPRPSAGGWFVWVQHRCDCWTKGTVADHVRGYTEREVLT